MKSSIISAAPPVLHWFWEHINIFKRERINIYALNLLDRTGNILHKYLEIFFVDVEMSNKSTKILSWYDGLMDGLSNQQTFIMNHIHLHQDLVLFYSR